MDKSQGEWLSANTKVERGDVQVGMDVFDADGEQVGIVKEVRGSDFWLDRPLHRDVYVPYDGVARVVLSGDDLVQKQLVLKVSRDKIDHSGWQHP
jgi:hypothetical protein